MSLNNYRAISLTSNVGKLFSRILSTRLTAFAEKKGLLPESQSAFRRGRGCEDNIFIVNSLIDQSKQTRKPLHMAFIDISKAYDNVDRCTLWELLLQKGISSKFVSLLQSMYQDTTRFIQWKGGRTGEISVDMGVRQGCPLSPLLFELYVAHIPELLDNQCTGVSLGNVRMTNLFYADDIVLLAHTEEDMRHSIQRLSTHLKQLNLDINCNKSHMLSISHTTVNPNPWPVMDRNGRPLGVIHNTDEVMYLGVKIGNGRMFANQVKFILQRANSMVGRVKAQAIQSLSKITIAETLWIFECKPSLLNSIGVFVIPKSHVTTLERCQLRLAKWLLQVSKSTSASLIRHLSQWRSLVTDVHSHIMSWWAKLMSMPSHRWPKQIFLNMVSNNISSKWYQEVQSLRALYNIDLGVLQFQRPQDTIRQIIYDAQRYEDLANIKSGDMPFIPTPDRDIWLPTAQSGNKELMAIWLRDAFTITGLIDMTTCVVCSHTCQDWLSHILLHCNHQPTQVTRGMITALLPTSHAPSHTWLMSRDPRIRALLQTLVRNWIRARQQIQM